MKLGEVVESIRPAGDDHTPGDKSAPWETVRLREPEPCREKSSKGSFQESK